MRRSEYMVPVSTTTTHGAERLLQALAEPNRLRLLALLLDGETCVCDLTSALEAPQPTVSRHLAVLRRSGWVTVRKQGLWAWYALAPATGPAHAQLVAALASLRDEVPELSEVRRRCQTSRDGRRCC